MYLVHMISSLVSILVSLYVQHMYLSCHTAAAVDRSAIIASTAGKCRIELRQDKSR